MEHFGQLLVTEYMVMKFVLEHTQGTFDKCEEQNKTILWVWIFVCSFSIDQTALATKIERIYLILCQIIPHIMRVFRV